MNARITVSALSLDARRALWDRIWTDVLLVTPPSRTNNGDREYTADEETAAAARLNEIARVG